MKKYIFMLFFSLVSLVIIESCSLQTKNEKMRILSIERLTEKSMPGHEICDTFSLDKEDIVKYFKLAKKVDGNEFNGSAVILPCKYSGSINIDGNLYKWEVNAGGAGYLYDGKKTNKRYLCKERCCRSLPSLC